MKVAVAVFILVVSLHAGKALECRVCPGNERCKLEDAQISKCSGSCMRAYTVGEEESNFYCSSVKLADRCASVATDSGKTNRRCSCNTDLCNRGPSISPPSMFGLTILLVAARGLLN